MKPTILAWSGNALGPGPSSPGDLLLCSQDLAGRPDLRPPLPVLGIHRAPRGAARGGQSPHPLLPLPAGAQRSEEDPADARLSDRRAVRRDGARAVALTTEFSSVLKMDFFNDFEIRLNEFDEGEKCGSVCRAQMF